MGAGAIKGFNDIFPASPEPFLHSALWHRIFSISAEVMQSYGYMPAWFPVVEYTELFTRGLGTDTDVVSKEMYSFTDRGDRSLSLRPEGTASAVRAYIEHHLGRNEPRQKWYYHGPMFRAERPQKGRYRQFYQMGVECFGAKGPAADVEVLQMLQAICRALGIGPLRLRINTLGDKESRGAYLQALAGFLQQHQGGLCKACQVRTQANPLRALDCKEEGCRALMRGAPDILTSLSAASRTWFRQYEALLSRAHLTYERSPTLVRGLDYYTEAIFEAATDALGTQDAVFGGGRYDGLVELLGGPATPAVGFAAGLERLALLMASADAESGLAPDVALVAADAEGAADVLQMAQELRVLPIAPGQRSHRVLVEADATKLKQPLKRADRAGARYVLVVGENERQVRVGSLKRLSDGAQQQVPLSTVQMARAMADFVPETG